jgi:hypothetical protein
MASKLDLVKSKGPLYILHLSSGKPQVFLAKSRGATFINLALELDQANALTSFAARSANIPWVLLVDQSEETFWGGVMPVMRGAAKTAWIERMATQSGSESPYRWSDLQGKSRSQPDKLRVLGYTLGRPEGLTPWLEALQACNARIRGLYSPVMLTASALGLLKIKPPKGEHDIGVLVTPHAEGIRQSVLVEGRVRFSRLALHPRVGDEQWFATVYNETSRLREYLTSSGLLKNDRAGMQLYVVLPPNLDPQLARNQARQHPKDQYQWIGNPLADLVYVAALAKSQPLSHLAPTFYNKRDMSTRITRGIYAVSSVIGAAVLAYAALALAQLWQKQVDVDAATAEASRSLQQYAAIAKNFPSTPLTAPQLVDMSKRWDAVKASTPPNMRDLLVAAGQILEQHPHLVIDSMEWLGDVPSKPAPPAAAPGLPPPASKEKKEIASLLLAGSIHGIASDDLRGTRDALSKLILDFNRNPNVRAEVIKKPLDLSTKASLSGSGKQESSELSFEIKLWQR